MRVHKKCKARLKRSTFNSSSVDQAQASLGSGILFDLVPAVYQRLPDFFQPRLLIVILVRLVADYFFCRPPVTGGERLIPAVEAEFGWLEIWMLQERVRRNS